MKKRKVYEGWRYECGGDLFEWVYNNGRKILYFGITFVPDKPVGLSNDEKVDISKVGFQQVGFRKDDVVACPCGKGCKPIRCRIIVENEVRGRRLHED